MSPRSATFGHFTVERVFPADPARVFDAFASPEGKARWFAGGPDWREEIREMDFREGGHERLRGVWANGETTDFRATYHDIVPGERIVYAYEMHHDEARISVSLATILIMPEGDQTKLSISEQGVYLDQDPQGRMGPASREHGIGIQADRIVEILTAG